MQHADHIGRGYAAKHPGSADLYARAQRVIAGGVSHDARISPQFPIYIERAAGTRKWDVDGNEYVDYGMGHGALLLGHSHPLLVDAVRRQVARGTHYAACHEGEVRWAELVCQLVPSAERVRFTSSGTEATLMALRLARAHSGREKILRLEGHFHGWHDYVAKGYLPPYDVPFSRGIPAEVLASVVVAAPTAAAVADALESDPAIGAVIVEPSGGSWGTVPLPQGFLGDVREIATRHGALLVFDEVITGFRWSPGGVQETAGVVPDLTALAKIMAGGLPGGAVAGRADIMERLAAGADSQWNRFERTYHPGTFNANPLSAAAGVAMLEAVADGRAQRTAEQTASELRRAMNEAARESNADVCVYGESSVFHVYLDPCPHRQLCDQQVCVHDREQLRAPNPKLVSPFKRAMLNSGVDLLGAGGLVSAVHSPSDVAFTASAFRVALAALRQDGYLS